MFHKSLNKFSPLYTTFFFFTTSTSVQNLRIKTIFFKGALRAYSSQSL